MKNIKKIYRRTIISIIIVQIVLVVLLYFFYPDDKLYEFLDNPNALHNGYMPLVKN